MQPKGISEHIRDHYEAADIAPEKLRRIIGAENGEASGMARKRVLRTAAAAILLGLFVGGSLVGGWAWNQNSWARKARRAAAAEVALNHRKNLRVEFRGNSLANLRQRMHRLDFSVTEFPNQGDLRLVGSRYCSIQGKLAIQLRLMGREHDRVTAFIARPAEDLRGLDESRIVIDGVSVHMWRQGNLLYAVARDKKPPRNDQP